jgi:acetyltransferase-like isoleucine patch superfamily enzyme
LQVRRISVWIKEAMLIEFNSTISKNIMVGRDRIVVRACPRATHSVSPDTIVAGNPAVKIGGGKR